MGKLSSSVSKEELIELHSKFSDKSIAQRYGVSDVAVSRLRKRWGISTKPLQDRKDLAREGLPQLRDLTPAKLEELYISLSDRQIAPLYGVSKFTIMTLRRQWGIQSVSKSARCTSTVELSADQKQICMGTLLGDGHLLARGSLRISHAWHQLPYLRWLHQSLSPIAKPIRYGESTVRTGTLCFAFSFSTDQHVWLKQLRKVFYPEGRRIFPRVVLENLSPLGLAVWYFDDGSLGSNLASFALGDISDAEAEEVCELVHQRFGLETYRRPFLPTCKIMGIRAHSSDIFFHLIQRYATPDMLHKLPREYWPTGMLPQHQSNAHRVSEDKLDSGLEGRCRSWDSLTDLGQESLLDDLVAYWQSRGFPHHTPNPGELETLLALDQSQVIREGLMIKPYQVGQATCQSFAQHIWEARSHGSKQSPKEVFEDPSSLRKAMRFRLSHKGSPMTSAEVRSSLRSWRMSGVYNFRPSAAKALVDRYGTPGGTLYDPCAGYGGRLLGSLLSQNSMSYVGCDPNREGIARLGYMVEWVSQYVRGVQSRVSLKAIPAEEFIPPECDLVLTSPPYWCREEYEEDSPQQSSTRYTTYVSWLEGFWGPVLVSSYRALRPGKWMLLNVDDFTIREVRYSLIEDTKKLCTSLGMTLVDELQYRMPRFQNRDNHEVVLAFVKSGVPAPRVVVAPVEPVITDAPDSPTEDVELSRCDQCGSLASSWSLKGGKCAECCKPVQVQVCPECGVEFRSVKGREFCGDTCYARVKRRKEAEARGPVLRSFTCQSCGGDWETAEKGNFKFCPTCKVEVVKQRDLEKRTKVCAYRHCEVGFMDSSEKNSQKFCHVEHRRREKLFREGSVTDISQFRSLDPIPHTIDLGKYLGGPGVYAGRDRGAEVRDAVSLPSLLASGRQIVVYVPLSVNSSFFLGMFGDAIRELGSAEEFHRHFVFEGMDISLAIDAGVREALR